MQNDISKIKDIVPDVLCFLPATIGLLLVLSGCTQTISHAELLEIPKGTEVNTLQTIIWYMGSKDGYDYFNVGIGKGDSSLSPLNKEYKVESENTKVDDRFKLTNDQNKWRVYYSPLKPYPNLRNSMGTAHPTK